MYLNFSLSHESGNARSHQTFQNGIGGDHSFISADPNAIIRNTAPATGFYDPEGLLSLQNAQGQVVNPFAGQQYVEGRWRRRRDDNEQTFAQLTLAWTLEAARWGRHNFVVVLGRSEAEFNGEEIEHVWEGARFNASPTGATNRVVLRNYVTPGDWSTYHVGDWMEVEDLVWNHPTLGPIRTDWQPSSMRSNTTIRENGLIAIQSYLFNNRLVTTLGLRKDEQKVTTRLSYAVAEGAYLNSNGILRIDENSPIDVQTGAGTTESLGVVYHFTDTVSAYYNQSNSFGPGNEGLTGTLSGWMRERGLAMDRPNEMGEGMDYGLKFRFARGKYNLDIGAYDTSSVNSSGNLGTNSSGAGSMRGFWNAIFTTLDAPFSGPQPVDPGDPVPVSVPQLFDIDNESAIADLAERYPNLRPNFVHVRDLLDRASSGYELRFTANPTDNLRVRITYSYTDNEKENILSRTRAETEQLFLFLADLQAATPGVNVENLLAADPENLGNADPAALTIGELLEGLVDVIGVNVDNNISSYGIVPHRINFHAGYDFQGRLRGLNVAGGVNWRAAARIGEYQVVDPADPDVVISRIAKFSNDSTDVSLSLRYRTNMKVFGNDTRATFQISASNLFRSKPEIAVRRYAATVVAPGAELPGKGNPISTFLLDPRTVSASVRFDF